MNWISQVFQGFKSTDMFTVSVVFRGPIFYRYHEISQIAPNYRYVGDINGFRTAKKLVISAETCSIELNG
jgi:hypothetical protein